MKPIRLTIMLLLSVTSLFGQNHEAEDHYRQLEERYKRLRDSLSLLHPFLPAISSIVLKNGQAEINLFNSLTTANRYPDMYGNIGDLSFRETYFYSTLQLTYSISQRSGLNVGLDIYLLAQLLYNY